MVCIQVPSSGEQTFLQRMNARGGAKGIWTAIYWKVRV